MTKGDWVLVLRCQDCKGLIDKNHTGAACPVRKSGTCLPFMRWERSSLQDRLL